MGGYEEDGAEDGAEESAACELRRNGGVAKGSQLPGGRTVGRAARAAAVSNEEVQCGVAEGEGGN